MRDSYGRYDGRISEVPYTTGDEEVALPTDKKERKETPVTTGVLDYFPDAIAAIARVSFVGNQQHNPGQPLHWARDKSTDHADCMGRHLLERGTFDDDGQRHSAKLAWRALANLQTEIDMENQRKKGDVAAFLSADSGSNWDAFTYPTDLNEHDYKPRHKRKPRAYIAGPMRGKEFFNFPAFNKAQRFLEGQGYEVHNPAEMDRLAAEEWTDPNRPDWADTTYEITAAICKRLVKRDLDLIQSLDPVRDRLVLLYGWMDSIGAGAEFQVAKWLKIPCYYFDKYGFTSRYT